MFWKIVYNLIIVPVVRVVLPVAGMLDRKIRRGIRGRRQLFETLEAATGILKQTSPSGDRIPRIWFHSSSMGEFEQAKPIIAELRRRYRNVQIIVSFFSPSGYDHSRSYKPADVITYIPFDRRSVARRFVAAIRPTVAVMVRYDVWPNHIWALREAGVPVYIANATLALNSSRAFPILRQFHYALYNAIDYILTVSEADKTAFDRFHLEHPLIAVIGDTRYDQVIQRCNEATTRHLFPPGFLDGKKVLVIGSSWGEDEDVLLPVLERLIAEIPELLVVIVPHEPNEEHLEALEYRLGPSHSRIRFSTLSDYHNEKIIIVDSIGILTTMYKYAHVAYVGGSFRQGIHNVLEPAVYGIPVVMGPRHENSQEAKHLRDIGAAFVAADAIEMYSILKRLFEDEGRRTTAGRRSAEYVVTNAGATERILSYLSKVLDYPAVHP